MDQVQFAKTIANLYQSNSNEERATIEQQLEQFESDPENHVKNVSELLISENPEICAVKKSLAVYLRNFVRKVLGQQYQTGNDQRLQTMIDIIYRCLVSPQIDFQLKQHIVLIFESLLLVYQSNEQNPDTIKTFFETIFEQAAATINSPSSDVIKGSLLICQAALQTIRSQQILAPIMAKISIVLTSLAEHTLLVLANDFVALQSLGAEFNDQHPHMQKILNSLDILYTWVKIHESVLERYQSKKYFGFTNFIQNEAYVQTLTQLLKIQVIPTLQQQHIILSLTGFPKLDNLISLIKYKTLEVLNFIFKYLFEQVPQAVKKTSPFLAKSLEIAEIIIHSLVIIAQRDDLEQLTADEDTSNLLVEMVETLTLFIGEKEFYQIFSASYKHLLVHVALNFLKTGQEEMEQMSNDPEQFVNLALDTCDKQNSKVVKTQGAKLLESLCDNIDGVVSFITIFCSQSLVYALGDNKENYTQYIAEFIQSKFLRSDPEIIGETCLVALTAISYILPRRNDLVPYFEKILAENIDKILNEKSILLRVRMSLLLGYYADMLFKKYPDAFMKIINFLITSISLTGKNKVIALQSADTLNTIISDVDLVPRLEPELPKLMITINECTLKINIKLYFNFLLDFVKHYHHAIGDSVIPFVEAIVQRILKELHQCHEKGEKNNLTINKCWNIIRTVIELDSFIPEFYTQIEKALVPLFQFMADPTKVEFEDDIILVIKTFIKKMQIVSPILWEIFPCLLGVFDKNKKTFGNLLDAVNYYLIYGKDQIGANKAYLEMVISMANQSLFGTEPNITIHNSEGAILYQLLFQIYQGTNFLDTYFENILTATLDRMKAMPMQDHLKRQLLLVFLSAMIYNPNATLNYMEQRALTQTILTEIFNLVATFKNSYERKLFSIGLTQMLTAQVLPPSIGEKLLQIVDNVIKMLNAQKEAEVKSQKKAGKKEIKAEDDDDDEDYTDEDEEEDEDEDDSDMEETKGEPTMDQEESKGDKGKTETQESDLDSDENDDVDDIFDLTVTMDYLNAPVKKQDEFAMFNQVLRYLHNKDPQYINNLIAQLNEEQKKFLREHIETRRITIEHKGVATEVARRIISVKRRTGGNKEGKQ